MGAHASSRALPSLNCVQTAHLQALPLIPCLLWPFLVRSHAKWAVARRCGSSKGIDGQNRLHSHRAAPRYFRMSVRRPCVAGGAYR